MSTGQYLSNVEAPKYALYVDDWKYSELKNYFEKLSTNYELMSATKTFLSNVEGLGDYFDAHPFFDFQAYLILNVAWFEKNKMILSSDTQEYECFQKNMVTFMSGKCDRWAKNKKELDLMKADCKKIYDYYITEELK